jgi:hypothetical protein
MTADSTERYRRLFEEMGAARAREMIDRLQVVALTHPETMRELETFLDRTVIRRPLPDRPDPTFPDK